MKLILTLPGCIRSKKNSKRVFARGRMKKVLPSKAYEAWELQSRQYLMTQRTTAGLLTGPVSVRAHIYYKGPQPDLSGCLESIGDCCEGLIWENDRQIISWDGSRLIHDVENPRTEITVEW